MDDFDFFYLDNHRPDPFPLTSVDFFHAKHRAIKEANAVAAAKGLPPRETAARYIDMAVVRNFDHYDDIGATPNDPVARELVRRKELEAAEAKRQGKTAKQLLEKRLKAVEEAREARKGKLRRETDLHAKEELRRAKARELTKMRVREAFNHQPRRGTKAAAAPPIHAPRKRKQSAAEGDENVNRKPSQDPLLEGNCTNDQENSSSEDHSRSPVLESKDENEVPSPSTATEIEAHAV